jgi:hypothetical protein
MAFAQDDSGSNTSSDSQISLEAIEITPGLADIVSGRVSAVINLGLEKIGGTLNRNRCKYLRRDVLLSSSIYIDGKNRLENCIGVLKNCMRSLVNFPCFA